MLGSVKMWKACSHLQAADVPRVLACCFVATVSDYQLQGQFKVTTLLASDSHTGAQLCDTLSLAYATPGWHRQVASA